MFAPATWISSLVITLAAGATVETRHASERESAPLDVSKRLIEQPVETTLAKRTALSQLVLEVANEHSDRRAAEAGANRFASKAFIESPLETVIAERTAADQDPDRPPADIGKRQIEQPTEALVVASAGTQADAEKDFSKRVSEIVEAAPDNPAVKPGDVNWHASFADAQAASERSGKPVLLFQLLGQLDQRFT